MATNSGKYQDELANHEQPSSSSRAATLIEHDAQFYSDRKDVKWMDGQPILADFDQIDLRPWNQCIPFSRLSKDNLPPFMVRLRDDQVGHLLRWFALVHGISSRQLGLYWPKTFTIGGTLWTGRDKWGPAYPDAYNLSGGPELPSYDDLGLPLT